MSKIKGMASKAKLFLEIVKNDNNIRNLLLTRLLTVAQIMKKSIDKLIK